MSYVRIKESTDETIVFEVRSDSRKKGETHDVYFDTYNGWVCTCEQYYYRRKYCKHMRQALEYYNSLYSLINKKNVFRGD